MFKEDKCKKQRYVLVIREQSNKIKTKWENSNFSYVLILKI